MHYSQELINKYKSTMLEQYGDSVDDEQAQVEIDSLARLFQIFADIDSKNRKK